MLFEDQVDMVCNDLNLSNDSLEDVFQKSNCECRSIKKCEEQKEEAVESTKSSLPPVESTVFKDTSSNVEFGNANQFEQPKPVRVANNELCKKASSFDSDSRSSAKRSIFDLLSEDASPIDETNKKRKKIQPESAGQSLVERLAREIAS